MPIHPTALVEDGALIHPSAQIGPYCLIMAGAHIGEGCVLDSAVRVEGVTDLGRFNRVCHGVTLGSEPQDLGFRPELSRPLVIGDHNHFKESVNISRGTKTDAGTRIGSHNYFMAFSHVGHDSIVGDHNILANAATLAGHVELAHHSFLAGLVAVHQFCRIGSYCMISGVCGVAQDVPPFVLAAGQRARFLGLNQVGLRRHGFGREQRARIKAVYQLLLRTGLPRAEALEQAQRDWPGAETQLIIDFISADRHDRGLIRANR